MLKLSFFLSKSGDLTGDNECRVHCERYWFDGLSKPLVRIGEAGSEVAA